MKDAILIATRSITPGLLQDTNRPTWRNKISAEGHVVERCVPNGKAALQKPSSISFPNANSYKNPVE
jgi:hypothetical protein